jgi:molybdate transport system substrate-binding protein
VRRAAAALACAALLLASCGGDGGSGEGEEHEITVLAAASLTQAFTRLGASFESEHPGVTVAFSFGPSDGLATQIVEGAPADVFASASQTWMDVVDRDGPGVEARANFARNRLAIFVPLDGPARIRRLDDLATPGVQLVVAAEGVPAGDYAREMLANAGIADAALANVVSNEEDVKGVIAKVISGDADAGIAYETDATPDVADRIAVVPIPDDVNVLATYPIAVVSGSDEAGLARRFVEYVVGDGQGVLSAHGFLPPA